MGPGIKENAIQGLPIRLGGGEAPGRERCESPRRGGFECKGLRRFQAPEQARYPAMVIPVVTNQVLVADSATPSEIFSNPIPMSGNDRVSAPSGSDASWTTCPGTSPAVSAS